MMKVYVLLTSAPMGEELLSVHSTPEKALERIMEALKEDLTEEEIKEQISSYGLDRFISAYDYSIIECEVDGETRRYSFNK